MSPVSIPGADIAARLHLRPHWRVASEIPLRGLCVVREGNYLFSWDANNCLQLHNSLGIPQSRIAIPGQIMAVAAADCGNCYAAVTREGNLFVLNADLSICSRRHFRSGLASLALDAHGRCILFSDLDGNLGMADLNGEIAWLQKAACFFTYLSFMPLLPFMVGASRLGLIACYDFNGNCVWTTGPVSHVGGMAVRGADGLCALACFSGGLQRYSYGGKNLRRQRLLEHCRMVAVPFASELFLTAGFSNRLHLSDNTGLLGAQTCLDQAAAHLAISAAADQAFVALPDGELVSFEIVRPRL
jgi:hypothetical protein